MPPDGGGDSLKVELMHRVTANGYPAVVGLGMSRVCRLGDGKDGSPCNLVLKLGLHHCLQFSVY